MWVDECGTHTCITRLYARASKGERAYASIPRNRGKNTTLIASNDPRRSDGRSPGGRYDPRRKGLVDPLQL